MLGHLYLFPERVQFLLFLPKFIEEIENWEYLIILPFLFYNPWLHYISRNGSAYFFLIKKYGILNPHAYHPGEELTTVKSLEVKEFMKLKFLTCKWKREMGGQGPQRVCSVCAALPTGNRSCGLSRTQRRCQCDMHTTPKSMRGVRHPLRFFHMDWMLDVSGQIKCIIKSCLPVSFHFFVWH